MLDELTYMISYKHLDETQIINTLNSCPKDQHVVITGRSVSKNLIELADTVGEIKDIKVQKDIDL
ncbi:cob(I)yrinic acid a,c-diamide adenosyltransferase [Candidatus Ruthia endofausta]|uniref:cob(I)yrinic acid a,c-diamide adenosyltransferase n=1 Tax=Candidatus Ruthia endofausta TaxID=2738852 RepID=UPI001FEB9770|nr:cob(I)yrinic acid a,c-diamide adenosyltransferase [Candidatus Ruthia endofausta]